MQMLGMLTFHLYLMFKYFSGQNPQQLSFVRSKGEELRVWQKNVQENCLLCPPTNEPKVKDTIPVSIDTRDRRGNHETRNKRMYRKGQDEF